MDPSTTLPLTVTLAVLAAAVTHATWNAIAHGIKDQTLAFALIGVGGIIVAIPLIIVAAMPRPDCWPYLLASIVIHVFYNLLLMRCYRVGEFGQVYPLARAVALAYGLPGPATPEQVVAISEGWRPYRTWVTVLLRIQLEFQTGEIAGRQGHARTG